MSVPNLPKHLHWRYRGDTAALVFSLFDGDTGLPFDPTGYDLIYSAKLSGDDPDSAAVIQKTSLAGSFVFTSPVTSSVRVKLVPKDYDRITRDTKYFNDIQAHHPVTGVLKTIAYGTLAIRGDITLGTVLSVPTNTSNPGERQTLPPGNFPGLTDELMHTATLKHEGAMANGDVFGYYRALAALKILGVQIALETAPVGADFIMNLVKPDGSSLARPATVLGNTDYREVIFDVPLSMAAGDELRGLVVSAGGVPDAGTPAGYLTANLLVQLDAPLDV